MAIIHVAKKINVRDCVKIEQRKVADRFDVRGCPGCLSLLAFGERARMNDAYNAGENRRAGKGDWHSSISGIKGAGAVSVNGVPILAVPLGTSIDNIRTFAASLLAVCDDIIARGERPVALKPGVLAGVASRNRPADKPYDSDLD